MTIYFRKIFVVALIISLAGVLSLFPPAKVFAATGDITAIRIVGATTGVADATSACNTSGSCNGWVAEVDMSGLNTGGTYSMGMGTNNNPSTAKLVCTLTSQGYDASGNTTTLTRTIYGTKQLRKIYNAGYSAPYPNDETSSGGTLTARFALSDFVYSSDTSVSCNISAGIYNDGSHSSSAATGVVVTNSSTLAYPKVIANWSWPGWSRITGSSFTVRAVAFNRSAMNGKPVAAVKFTATDQHSHSVTVTVDTPTIDGTMSDYGKVIEYIGTIPTTSFTAKDQITVNFTAYPWVGDSGAVLNTGDGVNSQPTPLYAPTYYVYDPSNTYGTAAAVVDGTGGNDSTCVAVAETAFDSGNPPAACATINKAAAVINAFNNSNYTRNDAAGTIYMKAGNYNWTGASNSISATVSQIWNTVMPFPGVAKSSVVINGQSGGQAFGGTKIKLSNVTVNIATNPVSVFNNIGYLWFDQSSLISNGTAPIYQVPIYYITRGSVGSLANGLRGFSTNSSPALLRGNDFTGLTQQVVVYTVLGNTNTTYSTNGYVTNYSGQVVNSTMPIFAFNKLYKMNSGSGAVIGMLGSTANVIGGAIIQNLLEDNTSNGSFTQIAGIAADGTVQTTPNVLLWHNTMVGGRINRGYNDSGSAAVLKQLWSEVGELRDQEAIKSDTFPTANANRTGNWPVLYGVGRYGTYNAEVSGGSPGFSATGSFQMEFGGITSYNPAIDTAQPPSSGTNAVAVINYVNRLAYDGTNQNTGGGDYHLTASSPALSLIPSGKAVLPYDLDGNARKNNGTGAAGAYEYLTATKAITGFTVPEQTGGTTIDEGAKTITLTVPYGTNVTALVPTITHNGASVSPASGVAHDFTSSVHYVVTAEDSTTADYTVTVTIAQNTDTSITSFDFASPSVLGSVDNTAHTVALTVPYGTSKTNLTPTIVLATGATISPDTGVATDFTNPVTYTVTAQDGTTHQDYVVTVTVAPATSHTITATAGANGSITPSGSVSVNDGSDQSFTITPSAHYHVADVLVDSSSVGAVTSYNFPAVSADHSISATFAIDTHTLTYTAGANGSITGTSPQTVNYGADGSAVTAVADSGYEFANWSDSVTDNPRTDTSISGDVTVTANFQAVATPTPTPVPVSGGGGGSPAMWTLPTLPVGGFKMSINPSTSSGQAASITSDRVVTLNFNAGSDIKKIAISMTGDFTDASQEDYTPTKLWDLCSKFGGAIKNQTCPDGTYTVYAKFYTVYGRSSPSAVASATITLKSGAVSENLQNTANLPFSNPFTKYLQYRQTDADVKRLQIFLNSDPDTRVADSGVGSSGHETNYFGTLTYKAVIKFQEKYAKDVLAPWGFVKGTGYVGKTTLAKLNELLSKIIGH